MGSAASVAIFAWQHAKDDQPEHNHHYDNARDKEPNGKTGTRCWFRRPYTQFWVLKVPSMTISIPRPSGVLMTTFIFGFDVIIFF